MFVVTALLNGYDEPFYYLIVQEDEYLKWATFWGFVLAAGIYIFDGFRQFKVHRQLPWFVFGLSLFCLFVAMEEISWGRRLPAYRAPDYFLEQNTCWIRGTRRTGSGTDAKMIARQSLSIRSGRIGVVTRLSGRLVVTILVLL
jgi:hypothetical protein